MGPGSQWHSGDEAGGHGADRPASLDAAALLDWLPLATLILASDGTAVDANRAWAALAAAAPEAAAGEGWLGLLAPEDRVPLAALLRAAAEGRQAGSAEARLAGAGPERVSRWWWRPGPAGRLVVCVAEVDGVVPRGSDDLLHVLGQVVHRLFGIGLEVQSAVGLAEGPVAGRLQRVVDELDELIRDARSLAFGRLWPDEPGELASGQ